MVKIALIVLVSLFVIGFILYSIGKKVKEKEKLILHQLEVRKQLNKITNKRNRQSTPKVPRIQK